MPSVWSRKKPVPDALLAWANDLKDQTASKSALGKALHYLIEQWPYLIRYLEDGRLQLSNNRAERSIKPFVMGRKNWLFANTPAGAQSSVVIYSLIETDKKNSSGPLPIPASGTEQCAKAWPKATANG